MVSSKLTLYPIGFAILIWILVVSFVIIFKGRGSYNFISNE